MCCLASFLMAEASVQKQPFLRCHLIWHEWPFCTVWRTAGRSASWRREGRDRERVVLAPSPFSIFYDSVPGKYGIKPLKDSVLKQTFVWLCHLNRTCMYMYLVFKLKELNSSKICNLCHSKWQCIKVVLVTALVIMLFVKQSNIGWGISEHNIFKQFYCILITTFWDSLHDEDKALLDCSYFSHMYLGSVFVKTIVCMFVNIIGCDTVKCIGVKVFCHYPPCVSSFLPSVGINIQVTRVKP